MKSNIINFPKVNNTFQPKWSVEDAIRHLSRVCNMIIQKQEHSKRFHFFPEKMHEDDIQSLAHSIRIVNMEYDLKLNIKGLDD